MTPRTVAREVEAIRNDTHKLTHFRFCARSRSIRLMLSELGIEAELAEEQPWDWRPAFLAMNPSGELPVLQVASGPLLAGSYAISEFLAEQTSSSRIGPNGVDLFPGTSDERAEVRRLIDWSHGKLEREVTRELVVERIRPYLATQGRERPDTDLLRALRQNLRYHMGYFNYLADQRNWLAGDELSFADLAAAAHLSVADYLGEIDWNAAPAARLWYARIKSRRGFRALLADRVPGLAPPQHYADLDF